MHWDNDKYRSAMIGGSGQFTPMDGLDVYTSEPDIPMPSGCNSHWFPDLSPFVVKSHLEQPWNSSGWETLLIYIYIYTYTYIYLHFKWLMTFERYSGHVLDILKLIQPLSFYVRLPRHGRVDPGTKPRRPGALGKLNGSRAPCCGRRSMVPLKPVWRMAREPLSWLSWGVWDRIEHNTWLDTQ